MSILWLSNEVRLEAVELWQFSATSVHELVVVSVHWPHDLLMVQNGAHAGHVRREACRLACCRGVVPWVRAVTENHCLLLDHRTLLMFKRSSSEIGKVGIGGGFREVLVCIQLNDHFIVIYVQSSSLMIKNHHSMMCEPIVNQWLMIYSIINQWLVIYPIIASNFHLAHTIIVIDHHKSWINDGKINLSISLQAPLANTHQQPPQTSQKSSLKLLKHAKRLQATVYLFQRG